MGAAAESVSLERDTDSRGHETAGNQPAPGPTFAPFVQRLFAGSPGDPPDSAVGALSARSLKAPVLQRAQRLYGNRASQHMVMRARALQRKCDCGGTCPKCQDEEEQRAVQRKSASNGSAGFDGIPPTQGEALDANTRQPLEAHFQADLSDVRVHTSPEAAESATSLDALAYTSGRDIYFAAGMYAPASTTGQRLIAHEVAHVVQQSSGKEPAVATKSAHGVKIGAPDDVLETEAERAAQDLMSGGQPRELTDEEQRKRRESAGTVQGVIQRDGPTPPPASPTPPPASDNLERIKEINNNLWVGPLDEYELEWRWNSYGAGLSAVYATADGKAAFQKSMARDHDLWKIGALDGPKKDFMNAIANVARGYLKENRDLATREKQAVGPDANSAPTPEQGAALQDRREAAERVKAARQAEAGLRTLRTGYYHTGIVPLVDSKCYPVTHEPANRDLAPMFFNPLIKPQLETRGDEAPCGRMPKWEETKDMWERLEGVIDGLTARYPALFALARDFNEEKIAPSEKKSDTDTREMIITALDDLIKNIDKTDPKLKTDFVLQLKPIHQTLLASPPWTEDFHHLIATEMLKGHERDEFWVTLGLGTLAAALFVIASLATGGLAAVLFGAAVGVGAGVAINSIDQYIQLRTASRTSLSKGTELVSSGQVTGALVTAVLDTVFVFLDAYSATKAIGAGTRIAESLGEKALPKTVEEATEAEAKLAEKTAAEVAAHDAEKVAAQLKGGAAREVTDDALKKAGYVLELEIEEAGEKHIYRRLTDGTWCRFSGRVCGLVLGDTVDKLAARAVEKLENPAAAALRETLESTAHEAPKLLSAARIAAVKDSLSKYAVLKALPDGAIERVVRAAFAKAEGGGLRKAVRGFQAAKGQLLEELTAARVAEMLKNPAGKTALGLGHVTEEMVFINGSRIRDVAGAQITDGIIAIQRGDAIEIVAVVESKAGEFSAGKLATGFTSLKRESADQIAEALRDLGGPATKGASKGIMERIRAIDSKLADSILKHEPIDREQLFAALDKLSDADLRAVKSGLGIGEGQIGKDVERIMEEATQGGLLIDGKPVKVKSAGRPSFIASVPTDVEKEALKGQVTKEGYKAVFPDFGDQALKTKEIDQIARDLVTALGPDLESAAKAAPKP